MRVCTKCGRTSAVLLATQSRNLFIVACKDKRCGAESLESLSIRAFVASEPVHRPLRQANPNQDLELA
jgi:hypothetical protein